jgi:methionyl-tRNA synthetase
VFWPGQLIGAGDWFGRLFTGEPGKYLTLPYDVPANEFMNLEGQKISGSRNWAIYGLDFLSRYDPDPLRYYLTANMPENRDSDWDWHDFQRRNNDELLATWGNLANRVLAFAYRNWDGRVPEPGDLRPADQQILAEIEAGFTSVGENLAAVRLRAGLLEALRLAAEVNKYLDRAAPWSEIKHDREQAGKTVFTALKAIDSLSVLFAPYLPFTSEALHSTLGYTQPLFGESYVDTVQDNLGEHQVLRYRQGNASGRWQPSQLEAGRALTSPEPLYRKLDAGIVESERSRLG